MLTITQLARQFNVSRSTLLYYEREGLLLPKYRSENGYRWYGDTELKRLETILAYRSYGLAVADIHVIVNRTGTKSQEDILREQFSNLELEIQKLKKQQKAIVSLLQQPNLLEETMMTKQRWVEIMQAAGLNEDDMQNWHRQFEKMEPEEHQRFLESLNIDKTEIKQIRTM
ncbi:MerR family transcriptional regulator [Teredinibacter sp. KSP-S5-2]|uniref:MerR family transcriptional regulator n=1 Tax=Teredinibacter sp. KSP-S5-2 TaxID=3034506 RepID=UPI0029346BCC|nr:MerR family transcriptional regulator [Teredinibacter sp. KSP-S5-2]WNO07756.1 MerR family transcriptional regulator [Teredinibacter sp. KSP-S5-2]